LSDQIFFSEENFRSGLTTSLAKTFNSYSNICLTVVIPWEIFTEWNFSKAKVSCAENAGAAGGFSGRLTQTGGRVVILHATNTPS
jgi:hypothetical protein